MCLVDVLDLDMRAILLGMHRIPLEISELNFYTGTLLHKRYKMIAAEFVIKCD